MSTTKNTAQGPLHLRVFLASPGDVADERGPALQVLEQLQYNPLLRGRITLEAVTWDKTSVGTPMLEREALGTVVQSLPPAPLTMAPPPFWTGPHFRDCAPLRPRWKIAAANGGPICSLAAREQRYK